MNEVKSCMSIVEFAKPKKDLLHILVECAPFQKRWGKSCMGER